MITTSVIDRVEVIRRRLLPAEGLIWSDLLLISAIGSLGDENPCLHPSDIICALEMDRGWVYRSIRRLEAKQLISVQRSPNSPATLSLTGWSRMLLTKLLEGDSADEYTSVASIRKSLS